MSNRWIKHPVGCDLVEKIQGRYWYFCSVCNGLSHHPSKYCPNCGARMEENDAE